MGTAGQNDGHQARTGPLAISLGEDCQAAHHIKRWFPDSPGGPFDYLITPMHSVRKAIDQDFADFLTKENLIFSEQAYRHVLDRLYDIRYVHHFDISEQFLATYEEVRCRMMYLIGKWRAALESGREILFVRQCRQDETDQVLELCDLIRHKHPDLRFGMIAASPHYQDRLSGNVFFKNIILNPEDWKGYDHLWDDAFASADQTLRTLAPTTSSQWNRK
jgi:hypothetical protein